MRTNAETVKTVNIAHSYAVRFFARPAPKMRCDVCLGGRDTITICIFIRERVYAKGTKRINYSFWTEYLFLCEGCANKYGMLSEDKPTLKKGLALLKMKGY